MFARWGNPASIARARTLTITDTIAAHNPRLAARTAELIRAKAKTTLTTAGLDTAGGLIAQLATDALRVAAERDQIQAKLTDLAASHADYQLLTSIPGMGPKTTVRFLAEVGDINRFPTGGHLASYAGLAPVNRQSGTGLNTVTKDRAGNHRLKNTLFLSGFVAARHDPQAAALYERLRNRGKHHNAAIICIARKRCDIIHAILRNRTPYQKTSPNTLQT